MPESLIDDVRLSDDYDKGDPILFQNPEIRKMLRLANVNANDIFFDLGCGWGQNIIIALTEFNVKRAIGLEEIEERYQKANERIEARKIDKNRYRIFKEDFDNLLDDKIDGIYLHEATVIFYGLSTEKRLLDKFRKHLSKGCRLICYYNCLFPEIMPDKNRIDFPFYVYTFPFNKTTSRYKWLSTILQKRKSTIHHKNNPTIDELWHEMRHDYDIRADIDDVKKYQKRLDRLLK